MVRPFAGGAEDVATFVREAASLRPGARRLSMLAGRTLVEEGEPAGSLFAILRGEVDVVRRSTSGAPRAVARMGPGEIFGEMSLLSGAPRLASVVAATDGELLELGREDLDAIGSRRPAAAEVVRRVFRERLLGNMLRASSLVEGLPEERRRALMNVVGVETCEAGRVIVAQGQEGKAFYVLLRGRCDVFHRVEGGSVVGHPAMHEGDVFGEIALLQGGAATATVRAATACVVLTLQAEWFDQLFLQDPAARLRLYALAAERLDRTSTAAARREVDEGLV